MTYNSQYIAHKACQAIGQSREPKINDKDVYSSDMDLNRLAEFTVN